MQPSNSASPFRVSPQKALQGLSCVIGNFHAQFLEGRAATRPSGYSVRLFGSRAALVPRPRCFLGIRRDSGFVIRVRLVITPALR